MHGASTSLSVSQAMHVALFRRGTVVVSPRKQFSTSPFKKTWPRSWPRCSKATTAAYRLMWRENSAAIWDAEFLAKVLPTSGARAADTIFWWPSRARTEASVRLAPRGERTRWRHTWWTTFFLVSQFVSGCSHFPAAFDGTWEARAA
jgi:hypothetical protein